MLFKDFVEFIVYFVGFGVGVVCVLAVFWFVVFAFGLFVCFGCG